MGIREIFQQKRRLRFKQRHPIELNKPKRWFAYIYAIISIQNNELLIIYILKEIRIVLIFKIHTYIIVFCFTFIHKIVTMLSFY